MLWHCRQGGGIELHIYGEGKERERLESLCGNYLGKEIVFHGRVERKHLQEVYRNSDIVLNTSLHDSGCLVVLEAMANGLPVICINTGGPKILTTDKCAIKIEPCAKEELLYKIREKILYLIKNKHECERMGKAGIDNVKQNFESGVITSIMLDKIKKVIDIS